MPDVPIRKAGSGNSKFLPYLANPIVRISTIPAHPGGLKEM